MCAVKDVTEVNKIQRGKREKKRVCVWEKIKLKVVKFKRKIGFNWWDYVDEILKEILQYSNTHTAHTHTPTHWYCACSVNSIFPPQCVHSFELTWRVNSRTLGSNRAVVRDNVFRLKCEGHALTNSFNLYILFAVNWNDLLLCTNKCDMRNSFA